MARQSLGGTRRSDGLGRAKPGLVLDQPVDGGRWLRAMAAPISKTRLVDGQVHRLPGRIVGTDVLEKPPTTRTPLVGNDDAVKWALFGTRARQTNMNGHLD